MVNDEKYINEVLDKLKKVSAEELDEAIQKVDMEEDIKLVEKFIEYSNYEGYIDFNDYIGECDIRAIENLLKRYKELEEELESEKFYHNADKEFIQKYHDEASELNTKCINLETQLSNSIPISVIQNKIEKYKREFDFYAGREHFEWQDGEFDGEQCDDIALKIGVLKELLEERNK